MSRLVPALALALVATTALAGKYNAKLDIGDPAPAWKDLPGVDGEKHSLADLAKKKVVVVVITCNSCGYSRDYEQRMNDFTTKYTTGDDAKAALVAINVNKVEEDLPLAMKARVEKEGLRYPYLFDESQKIAKDYGAIYTPTFFVLDGERKVVYMGPMDDASDAENVKVNFVEAAMQAVLAGEKPEVTEKPPIGCRVRYDDGRRGRRGREPGQPEPDPISGR